jgi:prepilin signal peptidase PulO-like enzyme (type II secretory pathway)
MAIILFVLVGWFAGWLINRLSNYLPRFSVTEKPKPVGMRSSLPAVWELISGQQALRRSWLLLDVGVEVLSALFFAVMWWQLGASVAFLFAICGYCFFLLIAIIDLKYRLVLNVLTYPAILVLLVLNLIALPHQTANILLGGGMAFGIFFLTSWLRPGELGGGDVKLATLIGVAFGFPQMLLALLVGAGIGGVVVIFLLVSRKAGWKSQIAYAPFLCLGAMFLLISHSVLILH